MVKYLNIINSFSDRCMTRIIDGNNHVDISYADYLRDIRGCAKNLETILGNLEYKHIGIISSNGYELLVLMPAIIFSRGVAVPLNNHESVNNLKNAIRCAELDLLICDDDSLADDLGGLSKIESIRKVFKYSEGEKELRDFEDSESKKDALIIFTSGTTSLSKGVVLSVGSLFSRLRDNLPDEYDDINKTSDLIGYITMPFYHIGGIMPWLSWTELGCSLCLSKDTRNIVDDLENNRIDLAVVTPAVLKLWAKFVKNGKSERLGGAKYLYVAGAMLSPDVARIFLDHKLRIIQLYGMTETGGDITVNRDMENHADSVGKVVDGVMLEFINDEICVKSWGNMKEYYNNPDETLEILKNGVIYTGDLGYIDDEGYVHITGRKKNLIILSGGENVSPEEIERELYKNSFIRECRAYELNDRIAVDIYAPDAISEDITEIVNTYNQAAPIYKRIYKTNILEKEMEKTALGKIKRN